MTNGITLAYHIWTGKFCRIYPAESKYLQLHVGLLYDSTCIKANTWHADFDCKNADLQRLRVSSNKIHLVPKG